MFFGEHPEKGYTNRYPLGSWRGWLQWTVVIWACPALSLPNSTPLPLLLEQQIWRPQWPKGKNFLSLPGFALSLELRLHPSLLAPSWFLPDSCSLQVHCPVPVCRLPESAGWGAPAPLTREASWSLENQPGGSSLRGLTYLDISEYAFPKRTQGLGLPDSLQPRLVPPNPLACVANILISSMPCVRVLWRVIRKGKSGGGSGRHFQQQRRRWQAVSLEAGGSLLYWEESGLRGERHGLQRTYWCEFQPWHWRRVELRGSFLNFLASVFPSAKAICWANVCGMFFCNVQLNIIFDFTFLVNICFCYYRMVFFLIIKRYYKYYQ